MLIAYQAIQGAKVIASDGDAGSMRDLIFHRVVWQIRYLECAVASRFSVRRILLVPELVENADWSGVGVCVRFTRKVMQAAPAIDEHELVSRQAENESARYFGWKPAWQPGPAGTTDGLGLPAPTVPQVAEDAILGSAKDLLKYDVHAGDDEVGYVEDLIFDDDCWAIRYFVIDVGSQITGRRVLMSPHWCESIDWQGRAIRLSATTEQLENMPMFDPCSPINRDFEDRLCDFYGRPKYWQ